MCFFNIMSLNIHQNALVANNEFNEADKPINR